VYTSIVKVLCLRRKLELFRLWGQILLQERFGLRLDAIDRERTDEIRKETELGSNPFDHIPLGLVSIDFLKQERVLDLIERSDYDVIVIDEAHHCMDLGAAQDRENSQRRRLSEVLARPCDSLLLLTATPHAGNDRSFASLCELLAPSLVDGRGVLRGQIYRAHVVRRLKFHIKNPVTGKPLFKKREVHHFPVKAEPKAHRAFIDLNRGILELVAPELRRAFKNRRYSDVLSYISLLKRSVSTVEARISTLNVVADRFEPCEICETTLQAKALADRAWQELEMCFNYQADLAVQTLADESLRVPRPYIGECDRGLMDEELLGKRPVEPLNFERYYPRDGDRSF